MWIYNTYWKRTLTSIYNVYSYMLYVLVLPFLGIYGMQSMHDICNAFRIVCLDTIKEVALKCRKYSFCTSLSLHVYEFFSILGCSTQLSFNYFFGTFTWPHTGGPPLRSPPVERISLQDSFWKKFSFSFSPFSVLEEDPLYYYVQGVLQVSGVGIHCPLW